MLGSQTQPLMLLALLPTLSSAYFANKSTGLQVNSGVTLTFDGRMPKGTKPTDFDSIDKSPYLTDSAYGENLTWSKIITIPSVPKSLFDPDGKEAAMEIKLTDESIFKPGLAGYSKDESNRRADLSPNMSIPYSTPVGYPDVSGHKTLHFSFMKTKKSLNYTHSYDLVWFLNQTFNHEQFALKAGTVDNTTDPKTLTLKGSDDDAPWVFQTPFIDGWHNFGMVMDFDKNTLQVLYSTGTDPLKEATKVVPNDNHGGGQYHFGLSKNPWGGEHSKHTGYQETGIDESIIFAGIFMEDSASGMISKTASYGAKGSGTSAAGKLGVTGSVVFGLAILVGVFLS